MGWAHSSDLADPTPFLEVDNLLLTTGTQFAADAPAERVRRLRGPTRRGRGGRPRLRHRGGPGHPRTAGRGLRRAGPAAAGGAVPDTLPRAGPPDRRRSGRAGPRPRSVGPGRPASAVAGRPLRRADRRRAGGAESAARGRRAAPRRARRGAVRARPTPLRPTPRPPPSRPRPGGCCTGGCGPDRPWTCRAGPVARGGWSRCRLSVAATSSAACSRWRCPSGPTPRPRR